MKPIRQQILDLVHSCPAGLTSAQIAEGLDMPVKKVTSHISRLGAYGYIRVVGRTGAMQSVRVWEFCPVQPAPIMRQVGGPSAQREAR